MQHILTITVNFLFISSAWASFIAKRHEDTCTKLCDDIHTINENTDKKIGEAETDIGNLRAECVCAFNKDVDARLEAIKREIAEMRAGCLCLTPKPVCDVGWSLFQGICYSYQSEKVNWDTAQERCLGLGGVLAAADTEDKSNFLIQLATDMGPGGGNPGPWLGGKLIGGQWVWTKTGDKLIAWASFIAKRHEDTCTKLCDDIHTINENTDKKIGEAETDIGNLRAECVCAFNKDVDARLEAIKREIAEMRAGCLCLTPKPVCDVGWSLFQGICYSYQSEKVNWDTAQERCLGLGGVLAAADTEDKSNFLIQLATDMGPGGGNPGPWLGGKLIGGQWVWTKTGDKLIYQNWGTGQPDHDYEKCLHIWTFTSGQWNNAPCTQLIPFICERPVSS